MRGGKVKTMAINRFIDVMHENMETKYDAGVVYKYENGFIVSYEQRGALNTFSVGQPVFDEDGNVMGYLGIGMYRSLNYGTTIEERTPVEHWTICLPTKFCVAGKKIFTYYQNKKKKEGEAK